MPKFGARVDKNHALIRDGLRALGYDVFDASKVGGDFPDLVVGVAGLNLLLEVKSEGGRVSAGQQKLVDTWRGQVAIVRSLDEALEVIEQEVSK